MVIIGPKNREVWSRITTSLVHLSYEFDINKRLTSKWKSNCYIGFNLFYIDNIVFRSFRFRADFVRLWKLQCRSAIDRAEFKLILNRTRHREGNTQWYPGSVE